MFLLAQSSKTSNIPLTKLHTHKPHYLFIWPASLNQPVLKSVNELPFVLKNSKDLIVLGCEEGQLADWAACGYICLHAVKCLTKRSFISHVQISEFCRDVIETRSFFRIKLYKMKSLNVLQQCGERHAPDALKILDVPQRFQNRKITSGCQNFKWITAMWLEHEECVIPWQKSESTVFDF